MFEFLDQLRVVLGGGGSDMVETKEFPDYKRLAEGNTDIRSIAGFG